MMEFRYTARDGVGKRISGVLQAESEAAALRVLDEKDLFPISVLASRVRDSEKGVPRRVRSRDVGIMYAQLADLIGAGVPVLRALDSLIRSTPNRRLVIILRDIRSRVADGTSLTEAMRAFPGTFPPLHTAMVQAGERASFLEDVLRSLSVFLERLDELRSKVLGAMIYPAMLTVVGATVMIGALVFFVPRFEPLLAGVPKSFPTRVIFGMSGTVRGYWHVLAFALGLGGIGLWWLVSKPGSALWLERWRLRLPLIGQPLRMVAITRFCRILGTMLANGVPLLQALAISKDATGSALIAERIAEAAESVRAGNTLSDPLRRGDLIPDQILSMIRVAEESNRLEKVLLQIAETVERRTNREVDQAVRLVEPLILCVVAAGIGFLALGLLLPIFTMASSLGKP